MNAESFRAQVRELLARRQETGNPRGESGRGVCVPLRLSCDGDLAVLAELVRRVAASPALAAAQAAGLLRFELSIDPALAAAAISGACCDDCARGENCRCEGAPAAAPAALTAPTAPPTPPTPSAGVTPVLRGVVTERDVKALPAACRLVGTAPHAVLTPLARDALRQRGITVQTPKKA